MVNWLQRPEPKRFFNLLEWLLKWGEENIEATDRAFRNDQLRNKKSDMLRSTAAIVPRSASPLPLSSSTIESISDWLSKAAELEGDLQALAIRVLAKSFDNSAWLNATVSWFGVSSPVELGPGELFPRLSPFEMLKKAYGVNLATRAGTLAKEADLECFGLLPKQLPYNLRVRFHGGWDPLDRIDQNTIVGVAIPWCGSELKMEPQGEQQFFGVAPINPKEANRPLNEVRELIKDAAQVVLLPEVVATPDVAIELAKELALAGVFIGVAGSAHVSTKAGHRNIAYVVSRGGLAATQEKIVGAVMNGRREDIESQEPRLEVFMASGWSIIVSICRDFIDEQIAPLISCLRPGLVMVPACSPHTSDFENHIAALASIQAHVLLANTCASNGEPIQRDSHQSTETPAVVCWGRPTREPISDRIKTIGRHEITPPFRYLKKFV